MNKDDFDLLHKFKREQINNAAIDFYHGLGNRSLGFVNKNVGSKESLELFAEEEFVRKKDFSEMRCEMPGIPKSTFLMAFSPDGTKVASTHGNHNIYITDLRNGRNIKTLVGHPRTPWCIAFHPTSDQIVASGCLGGQVRIWDLSGGSEVWTAVNQSVIASLAFHPNDRVLAIATYNCVYFWDWSQPEPFVSAATYNVKEKVRYVAFDAMGHKLITGIANSPMTRWERVRAPVPVPRQEWCASPYRRRITQRLANTNQNQPSTTDTTASSSRESQLSFPERERRISMCYRTLVREYEQLVHRYLQLYRSPTMIDRGTDPMEPDHWFNNSGTQTTEPQPNTSDTTQSSTTNTNDSNQNQPTTSAVDRVLEETLPSSSNVPQNNNTDQEKPSCSSQSPQKSAHNLLTPSRIFSVIKKPNTLIRGTQTSESRKHKTEDSEQPKEKRLKKNNGDKRKSSKGSKDGKTNSTQTEQTATVRKIVTISTDKNTTSGCGDNSSSSSSSSEFRIRSNKDEEPGPSGFRRQEGTETEEEINMEPSTSRNSLPSTSRESSSRRGDSSNQANVDELLSSIKRTAEEEVRNRILPIIRSLPATDRPELIRLFENSREHVRMRFKQMYPNFLRKTNRRHLNHVDTTSDSSSSEEEMNSHSPGIRRSSNNSSQQRETSNEASTSSSHPCSALARLIVLLTDIDDNGTDREAQTSRDRENSSEQGNNLNQNEPTDNSDTVNTPTTLTENPEQNQGPRVLRNFMEEWTSDDVDTSVRDTSFLPPVTIGNTSTRTTNSTIYTSNSNAAAASATPPPRRRFFSHRISAFMPTRVNYIRHRRMPHYLWSRNRFNTRSFNSSTFGVDELFNYSELDNSEDDPPPPPPPPDADHPEIPTNACAASLSEIVRELESSLENVVRMGVSTRPGDNSNILSNLSERLDNILTQSDTLLRNITNTMDVLNSTTIPGRYGPSETNPTPNWDYFDSNFYIRDHRSDNLSPDSNNADSVNLLDIFSPRPNFNAVASDHTYPRNPEDAHHSSQMGGESGPPLRVTIHLTIMHIQRQARLLRQQIEDIERIDRAMLEVEQLQLIRRLIVGLILHFRNLEESSNTENNQRSTGTGLSGVREMMAGTRISDNGPRETNTEEPSNMSNWRFRDVGGSGDHPGNDLSNRQRSEPGTSGTETTHNRPPTRNSGRKTYPPSRMCRLARQFRRPSVLRFFLRPYSNRQNRQNRNASSRPTPTTTSSSSSSSSSNNQDSSGNRYDLPSFPVINTNTMDIMTRRLERFLTEEVASFTTFGQPRPSNRPMATIDLGEHILSLRLHACVLRMDRILARGNASGRGVGSIGPLQVDPTAAVTRDGLSRYNARYTLSLIIDSMSRHAEDIGYSPIPQDSQIPGILAMSHLLSELMLLVVVDSIPPPTGLNLVHERVHATARLDRLCSQMLQTRQYTYSQQLTRNLRLMKMTMRHAQIALSQTYHARRNSLMPRHGTDRRMLLGSINRGLRTIRRHRLTENVSNQDSTSNNTEWLSSISNLIAQISTRTNEEETSTDNPQPSTSRSFQNPINDASSNNDNSDDDDEDADIYNTGGSNLYRTNNINLSPALEQTVSANVSVSPPVTSYSRPWNVPLVAVNDVPVSEPSSTFAQRLINQRARFAERVSELRSNPQMGLFRPRFLHPLYASVNPFDADLDDPQREQIYDSDMVTTVTPNHRLQAWNVSDWSVPNIGSPTRNLIVGECKIHNDASVDIAKDGTILVTLLPSGGYLNVTNRLGVYSLKWETLGQCLYTTSFEQNAVSVSLSPLSRHLVVGLASRIVPNDRWIMARIFKIHQKDEPGDRLPVIRELEQNRDSRINCIRWLPISGQGLIYATNTGQLVVLT
ncbi:uncharacterized protein LOC130453268 [Diorhabda sublineata]|uniref:uncharacterized protein LOC130453268 n=1 Tax=Diorhabda sublineata TaxID=1163346 RepID=UPI0024E08BA4|nr:uncharacterized protein LOC130453268 [Diorhabda sublineata]